MRSLIITFLFGTVLGVGVCWLYFPKTVTVVDTKEVQTEVEKIKIQTEIVEKPDGERVTTKVEFVDRKIDKTKTEYVPVLPPKWYISGGRYSDESWSMGLHRRFFNHYQIGIVGKSNGVIGLELTIGL